MKNQNNSNQSSNQSFKESKQIKKNGCGCGGKKKQK
ncbi:hypothetical protein J2Y67_003250 [Neobacillus niacini]|nr:hypothetical protein [Neobacillus niacini]